MNNPETVIDPVTKSQHGKPIHDTVSKHPWFHIRSSSDNSQKMQYLDTTYSPMSNFDHETQNKEAIKLPTKKLTKKFLSFNKKHKSYIPIKSEYLQSNTTEQPGRARSQNSIDYEPMLKSSSLGNLKDQHELNYDWDIKHLVDLKAFEVKDICGVTIISKISSKDLKKIQITSEFFRNEISFLEVLSIMGENFYEPLSRRRLMTKSEVDQIFSILPEFFDLHKKFTISIAKFIKGQGNVDDFIDVVYDHFVGSSKNLCYGLWERFLSENSQGRDILKKLISQNIKLRHFITSMESSPTLKKMGIFDLFQTIHKHLAEYPMYFDRYLDNTPPSHPYRDKIILIIESCKDLLWKVNERLKQVDDEQNRSYFSKKILSCVKSEKFAHFFPRRFQLSDEKIGGNYNAMIETRKGSKSYVILITTHFLFIFTKKSESLKIRPIEVLIYNSDKRAYTMVIAISHIKSIDNNTEDSSKINILFYHFSKSSLMSLQLQMDFKEQRNRFVYELNQQIENLREAIPKPLSPYNNSLPELSSTDNIQESRSLKYYELEFNDQNLHSLAVNHVTKLESLQNESNISHRNDAQKVLDSICEYIASIDPNASRVDHDKVDQLINTLTMLNDKSSTYENLGHSKHRNILRSDSLNIEISPNYEKISLDEKSYSSEPELPLYDFYDVY